MDSTHTNTSMLRYGVLITIKTPQELNLNITNSMKNDLCEVRMAFAYSTCESLAQSHDCVMEHTCEWLILL